MKVGVLALQGAFQKHIDMLDEINISSKKVRYKNDFSNIDGLIIPGGESTTLSKLIVEQNLKSVMSEFLSIKPVFGTCAGLILLGNNIKNKSDTISFKCINLDLKRNGWGRQINSFQYALSIKLAKRTINYNGIFIRAPKIYNCNGSTKILATIDGSPVLVQNDMVLGATFHPELTNDNRLHKYFINMIENHPSC